MNTYIEEEAPYYYLCISRDGLTVRIRLRRYPFLSDAEKKEVKELLEKEYARYKKWQGAERISLNPFGVFVVPPEAQHINGRHFSATTNKFKRGK